MYTSGEYIFVLYKIYMMKKGALMDVNFDNTQKMQPRSLSMVLRIFLSLGREVLP